MIIAAYIMLNRTVRLNEKKVTQNEKKVTRNELKIFMCEELITVANAFAKGLQENCNHQEVLINKALGKIELLQKEIALVCRHQQKGE